MKARFLVAVTFALALTSARVVRAAAPTVPECLSASEASIKLRSEHKLRLARAQLLTCVSTTCPGEVAQECSRQMDQLTAQIPTIVFEVKDAGGNELSAVKVTMDGEVVADHLDGSALTLDPGNHTFTFEGAGQPTTTLQILLHDGDKDRHVGVTLASSTTQARLAPAPIVPPFGTPPSPSSDGTPSEPGRSRRVLGLVVGGVGVAGVAVGGVFGGLSLSEVSTTKRACPTLVSCTPQAINDRSTAATYGNVSTAGFVAGGVLLAGGLTLYLTAPKSVVQAVGVEVGPGMLGVKGRF